MSFKNAIWFVEQNVFFSYVYVTCYTSENTLLNFKTLISGPDIPDLSLVIM